MRTPVTPTLRAANVVTLTDNRRSQEAIIAMTVEENLAWPDAAFVVFVAQSGDVLTDAAC